jgi:hypothetical protein
MHPRLPCLRVANSSMINAVDPSESALRYHAAGCPNLTYLLFGQFRFRYTHSFKPIDNSVLTVLVRRYPSEVHCTVVPFIAIAMMNLVVSDGLRPEGGTYKLMKSAASAAVMPRERNLVIRAHQSRPKDSARPGGLCWRHPSHSSDAGDLVPAFPANDRPPLFLFRGQGELCKLWRHRKLTPFGAMQRDGSGRRRCFIIAGA